MFDNKYPYTDFHELNLDWILEVVKRVETEWPEFKTTMETEWNTYKDGLTGEDGEWPTFKTQIETIVNNFIHDVVGPYNENLDYKAGMFCYHEGNVYCCTTGSSAAFPRPFSSYSWFNYAGQNIHSIVNDLFNYLTDTLNGYDTEIYYWIQHTAEQWDETKPYVAGDYCSAYVGGYMTPSSWRYYKCIQACTGVNVFDTNYWKEVIFASDVAETIAAYKQAMQNQYDEFLEDYQRTFGVVQTRGSSTTDVMSQKAVSDELQAHDDMLDNLIKDIAPVYDSTKAYKIGNLLSASGKMYLTIKDAPAGTPVTNTEYFEEKSVADIIEMIKAGSIVVGHSQVADNLTPYSEDSGAIQDTPFISQETGTANNSVIVTTGDTAKQLEKIGNAIVVNEKIKTTSYPSVEAEFTDGVKVSAVDTTNHTITIVVDTGGATANRTFVLYNTVSGVLNASHKYLQVGCPKGGSLTTYLLGISPNAQFNPDTGDGGILTNYSFGINFSIMIRNGCPAGTYVFRPHFVDLTQWFNGNENIPQDVLNNPSHFSWYYNGELTYNAGSIEHGEGVKLVCTRGRNLLNKNKLLDITGFSKNGDYIRAIGSTWSQTNLIQLLGCIVPNVPYHFKATLKPESGVTNARVEAVYTDGTSSVGNLIQGGSEGISTVITTLNKTISSIYITYSSGSNINFDVKEIDLEPYYTEQQGGEGYDEFHDYEEPDIIDTGSEQLGAFDKKTPDGVISRNGTKVKLKDLNWGLYPSGESSIFIANCPDMITTPTTADRAKGIICALYLNDTQFSFTAMTDKTMLHNDSVMFIRDTTYPDATSFQNHFTDDDYLEYKLDDSAKYTEQGTSFRQYAGINDYGIMYWLGANDELVSIPQGLKIQYPVNYKGFIDDAYMYTNGDVTALAKNESITDTALADRGYLKLTALSGYDATKTQTLKNVQGVFTWIDD